LLSGLSGTGKTSVVRAIANEGKVIGVLVFAPKVADLLEGKDATKHEARLTALFVVARACAPSIIFVDECDDLMNINGGRKINHLKTAIQKIGRDRVLFIGVTNNPERIDKAIMSRFGDTVTLPLPDGDTRRKIIETALRGNEFCLQESDWKEILARTEGRDGRWLAHPSMGTLVRQVLGRVRDADRPAATLKDFRDVLDAVDAAGPAQAAAGPAPAGDGKRKAATTGPAGGTVAPARRRSDGEGRASCSSSTAAPGGSALDATVSTTPTVSASTAAPEEAEPDHQLCEELDKHYESEASGLVALKRVYQRLHLGRSEVWKRVPTYEAAGKGQHAPQAQKAVIAALMAHFKLPADAVYLVKDREVIKRVLGTDSKQAWIVRGIAEKSRS